MEHTTNVNPNGKEVIDALSVAIGNAPDIAELYYERGWAKTQFKDVEGGLKDWSMALQLDPAYAEVYEARALAYFLKGDLVEAKKDALLAKKLNPQLNFRLEHLQKLMDDELQSPGASVFRNNKPEEIKAEDKTFKNPRREFLKHASLLGAGAFVASSVTSCTPAVLKGQDTNVRWGKIIDLKRCVGCKACSVACKAENHTPPGIAYHVVMETQTGTYPYNKREFLPMPCMQCRNSTCVPICPVKATYHRPDGVVVVDYDKCIGCRYCIATCPYGSRSFDYGHYYSQDQSNPWENQPSPEYGQYRLRDKRKSPIGNVRKCTSCLHRIYNGIPPACAASCMGNAIHFGDLNNPDAKCMVHGVNLQELLARRNYKILKEETGNSPRVYYLT